MWSTGGTNSSALNGAIVVRDGHPVLIRARKSRPAELDPPLIPGVGMALTVPRERVKREHR